MNTPIRGGNFIMNFPPQGVDTTAQSGIMNASNRGLRPVLPGMALTDQPG